MREWRGDCCRPRSVERVGSSRSIARRRFVGRSVSIVEHAVLRCVAFDRSVDMSAMGLLQMGPCSVCAFPHAPWSHLPSPPPSSSAKMLAGIGIGQKTNLAGRFHFSRTNSAFQDNSEVAANLKPNSSAGWPVKAVTSEPSNPGSPAELDDEAEMLKRQELFNTIAPMYDNLNDWLSLGQHRVWKRMAVSWAGAKAGETVLDICCGSGDLAFLLAQKVGPSGKVIGLDFAKEQLVIAADRQQDSPRTSAADMEQVTAFCHPVDTRRRSISTFRRFVV
ncbi:hypothetical protein Mp_5g06240 [Marchantia polymorpha subsp. ruderalis]|uniref:2-phytyl-1,4-beta-naphthoquinone methyltransferase, chloroplastic n=2 Tax=Marchantia polymorpha TaxID=3197 RepID=A0AAF6BFI3_MARPO|nr:hypothetical protein MARPO_0027s0004 [Marchantia polymorpha]BBN10767.1 hypothetical protein Mp_5g06240 [Marchantia polymorpha subsp. ruderalis]|eukprot:PTQ42868.1 hypothetical protein MARPO_0027s0004 [Marchantia polymorpha]